VSAPSLSSLVVPPAQKPSVVPDMALRQQGLLLRPAEQRDLGFLRTLYGVLRVEELASIDWPEAAQQAFLDSQFALQHYHFTSQWVGVEFFVLECHGQSMGRLYVLRELPRWLIVDIALLPAWQNRGIGKALLTHLQQDAQHAKAQGLALHVRLDNRRAHALYARLGFRDECIDGMHTLMHWDASPPIAQLNTA